MMTDPIADMLTRIRNAQVARKSVIEIPFSKVKFMIGKILLAQSYITEISKVEGPKPVLAIVLKYHGKAPAITSIKRESKPGHRVYRRAEELPNILNGFGFAIVSTSQGMMTVKEAKEKGIGGEVVCSIY
ncbi:MAG: 30S ribosomal protein S8 [Candidatus Magasanikbacteria bacterium CG_4_10_14_0_8_um_filter_32_14]|uniref:Small ribosomal subunit protein uS8 n=2 Tax=Candidatus Magasanikiibacteriota TaxID=1752731 RepID=A0A2M7R8T1_9BACT|nr:MAG: 30S ribosomal protein S8 [Candidatus Magasanikbacteria bacterium CG1_02_32_51]PIY93163.1 MAG: 30S ribosomal protein S8 [Candidatus Magasanikbacteria bacterium CG_4_10_14_0_8_um_filter_32_14]